MKKHSIKIKRINNTLLNKHKITNTLLTHVIIHNTILTNTQYKQNKTRKRNATKHTRKHRYLNKNTILKTLKNNIKPHSTKNKQTRLNTDY